MEESMEDLFLDGLKFDVLGLIPVITQDYENGQVLMLAYANREAMELTLSKGTVHYYSRSRQELWHKGATSGHFQEVKEIFYDCDKDTVLIKVKQVGAACHTGNRSCFYRSLNNENIEEDLSNNSQVLLELYDLVTDRQQNPKEGSYTNYLLNQGIDKILKKVGEEATETIIAAKNGSTEETVEETSDLLYHLTVMLRNQNISWDTVFEVLRKRELKEGNLKAFHSKGNI